MKFSKTTMLKRANEHEDAWKALLENSKQYPELADEFKLAISGKLPKTIEMNYHALIAIIITQHVLIQVK